MIEEELKGVDIDGSGKITICAHQVRPVPGEEKYICDHEFHISVYYLDQEEINAIENADKDTEPMSIGHCTLKSMFHRGYKEDRRSI